MTATPIYDGLVADLGDVPAEVTRPRWTLEAAGKRIAPALKAARKARATVPAQKDRRAGTR